MGRSPRVRGSRIAGRDALADQGSIPACAGEPCSPPEARELIGVDPRVCGGAEREEEAVSIGRGRSPRVRGSPLRERLVFSCSGSIPACAGEPGCARNMQCQSRVDPRVCGGAAMYERCDPLTEGRSPRVRGSRKLPDDVLYLMGSIPACAGEPAQRDGAQYQPRVDPRVCGGAAEEKRLGLIAKGRSPRVRGSRHGDAYLSCPPGSIPACAGEPTPFTIPEPRSWVDPRVCGGALAAMSRMRREMGRSPRVRGSRSRFDRKPDRAGSIPACAGEPAAGKWVCLIGGVDPRVCGGAGNYPLNRVCALGRSPRVRGSLRIDA